MPRALMLLRSARATAGWASRDAAIDAPDGARLKPMLTICPKCALTLLVTAEDLRVAQGYVRCGRCSSVFNALARLTEERQEPEGPPESAPTQPSVEESPASTPTSVASAPGEARENDAPPPPPPPAVSDEDAIPDDALEFDPARTDASSVFVEPAPSPEWSAATGTFKAMMAANQEAVQPPEMEPQALKEPRPAKREQPPAGRPPEAGRPPQGAADAVRAIRAPDAPARCHRADACGIGGATRARAVQAGVACRAASQGRMARVGRLGRRRSRGGARPARADRGSPSGRARRERTLQPSAHRALRRPRGASRAALGRQGVRRAPARRVRRAGGLGSHHGARQRQERGGATAAAATPAGDAAGSLRQPHRRARCGAAVLPLAQRARLFVGG